MLRISKLWLTARGSPITWTRWAPTKASTQVATPPDSSVIRVMLFKAYLPSKDWSTLRGKQGATDDFRSKLRRTIGCEFFDFSALKSSEKAPTPKPSQPSSECGRLVSTRLSQALASQAFSRNLSNTPHAARSAG